MRAPGHQLGTLRAAWAEVSQGVTARLGLVLPEPQWMESHQSALYCRQVRLARIVLGSHSVGDLTDILVDKAGQLLTLADSARILEGLRSRAPVYGAEMDRLGVPTIVVHSVLRLMLSERVSIADLDTVLEALLQSWKPGAHPEFLYARVREAMDSWLCQTAGGETEVLQAIALAPRVEKLLQAGLTDTPDGKFLDLDARVGQLFLDHLNEEIAEAGGGRRLLLMVEPSLRLALSRFTASAFPDLMVLTWSEIASDYDVSTVAVVDFKG